MAKLAKTTPSRPGTAVGSGIEMENNSKMKDA
jgi:hypothetical protein